MAQAALARVSVATRAPPPARAVGAVGELLVAAAAPWGRGASVAAYGASQLTNAHLQAAGRGQTRFDG